MLLTGMAFQEILPLVFAVGLRVNLVFVALASFLHVEVAHVHVAVEREPRVRHSCVSIER